MTSTEAQNPVPPKHVLVVEDEALATQTIRAVLAADGHTVETAETAERALAMFQAGAFDLIITDFKLAEMDGLELAEAVKKDSPATPIILITAYAEKLGGTLGKVSNIDILLRKPFSMAELQAAVNSVFRAS